MNKAKLIEALNMAIEAIEDDSTTVAQNVEANVAENKETPKKTAPKKPAKAEKKEEPVAEETATEDAGVTVDDIKSMGYNDLKKYAQSIGIKAVGTRDQIVAKVISALENDSEEVPAEEEVVEEPKSNVIPMDKKKSAKGGLKKKAEEPAEEAEEEDEVAKAVRAEAEEMDVTDIAELLQSVGIKASGKKDKLIELLIGAVKDGKLDFSDDEEEAVEDAEEEVDVEDDGEEVDFHEYHEQYDLAGLNDPSSMSKKRAKAVSKMIDSEIEAIENGDTTEKDIKDFLETVLTEGELENYDISNMDETELLFLYIELMKSFIDDDGEAHEPSDPYVIGEENVCCGHTLVYDEEAGQYICESCGETYEAE